MEVDEVNGNSISFISFIYLRHDGWGDMNHRIQPLKPCNDIYLFTLMLQLKLKYTTWVVTGIHTKSVQWLKIPVNTSFCLTVNYAINRCVLYIFGILLHVCVFSLDQGITSKIKGLDRIVADLGVRGGCAPPFKG